jgi:16S rRNA (uracil1498-N3)-methyltransferase
VLAANLFAELHAELAPDYQRALKPGGLLLATGILEARAAVAVGAPAREEVRRGRAREARRMAAAARAPSGSDVRARRVFVAELHAGELTLAGGEAQHLLQVLRLGPGARVRAFDGRGLEADGVVAHADALRVTLKLGSPRPSEVEAALAVTLAVALLKGDKLSEVVRRGTELGVVRFTPFLSERCDVRELSPNKLARLRRVAQEAAKQSGRSVVPPVAEAVKLAQLEPDGRWLVAAPEAEATLRELLAECQTQRVTVVTGPEGGFSPAELNFLEDRGAQSVQLGARTLRAETAPIAVAAALLIPEAL